jgi:hypothetical protein
MSQYPGYNPGGYAPPQPQYQNGGYYPPPQPNYNYPSQPVQPGYGYQQAPPPQQQYAYQQQVAPQQQYYGQPPVNQHPRPPPSSASNSYGGRPSAPPTTPQHFGQGAPQSYAFRYSNCTGRRKGLLIGINYFGQRGQLRGCINDVRNMTAYLVEHFGYRREDMVILTDDQQNPMSQPTKQNILRAMHWLVKGAAPNDSLFFHYSGELQFPA